MAANPGAPVPGGPQTPGAVAHAATGATAEGPAGEVAPATRPVPAGAPQAMPAATENVNAPASAAGSALGASGNLPASGSTAATAEQLAPGEADLTRLAQPSPTGAATVPGADADTAGEVRRPANPAASLAGDDRLAQRAAAGDVGRSAMLDAAAMSGRMEVAGDDNSAALRLGTEALQAPAGADAARPATSASAAPPFATLAGPATALSVDSTVQPGVKTDVTGVLVARPGEPAWNNEVAGRISLLLRNGMPEASLQLNPPELGRMDVRIATDGDQARILFTVQGAETRDLVEQALPRLRDMLAQDGLSLARFDVADQSSGERQAQGEFAAVASPDAELVGAEDIPSGPLSSAANVRADALVDYYA
ncbi:MAG: hypothetical protein CME59_21745 [Halioglobus sp.]|nr:hypothetical protein [Halioglobus sp.]